MTADPPPIDGAAATAATSPAARPAARPGIDAAHVVARFRDPPPMTPRVPGDFALNPGMAMAEPLVPAAVLVPLIVRPEGMTALFTQRTGHLAHHAGQISFPGGHVAPEDETPEETALRETEEEVGLARRHVEIVGRLAQYVVRTGFTVTPVVGMVTPPFALIPDPHEVAEIFEVPLDFLVDPANHQRHSRDVGGRPREFYAIPYRGYYIWGATAGMLVNLSEVLRRR
jgi:8-oxo-dGTP pyrophosphatase MutT (NUDIX family)